MIKFDLNFTTSKLLGSAMFLVWAAVTIMLTIKDASTVVVPFTSIMIPTIGGIVSIKNFTDKGK